MPRRSARAVLTRWSRVAPTRRPWLLRPLLNRQEATRFRRKLHRHAREIVAGWTSLLPVWTQRKISQCIGEPGRGQSSRTTATESTEWISPFSTLSRLSLSVSLSPSVYLWAMALNVCNGYFASPAGPRGRLGMMGRFHRGSRDYCCTRKYNADAMETGEDGSFLLSSLRAALCSFFVRHIGFQVRINLVPLGSG